MNEFMGDEQILTFLHIILANLLPRDHQETSGEYPDFWCSDYWTLEVLKCLYRGKEQYLKDPPPKRLEANYNFAAIQQAEHANRKEKMYNHLLDIKDDADNILICEVGWGIDVYVATKVKEWTTIRTYDSNNVYGACLSKMFNTYNINYTFEGCSTKNFKFNEVEGDWIVIGNHSRNHTPEELMSKDKIKHVIWDGNLIW